MIARLAFFVITFLLVIASVGCVDDDRSFYIARMNVPLKGCTSEGERGDSLMGSGYLDVSLKLGYIGFPLIINSLEPSEDKPERNKLQLKEIKIKMDRGEVPIAVPEMLLNHSEPVAGDMLPGDSLSGGIDILSDDFAAFMAANLPQDQKPLITAKLRAVATRSGSELETPEFSFGVKLCNGCLVDMRDACPTDPDNDTSVYSNLCGRPQDGPVTCCIPVGSKDPRCFIKD
jgi:hypothetical protein